MGICSTKKTIEEIIHSKYTLAKDSIAKDKTPQFYHSYVWKYAGEDLSIKEVKFFDSQNGVKKQNKGQTKNSFGLNRKKSGQDYDTQNDEPQFLQGEPLQWPIKTRADQGYIILTVKNNRKRLQNISCRSRTQQVVNCQQNKQLNLRLKKVSLQLLQILYMIHLDSFKSYYFTQIKQEKENPEFEASIEIVTGDLLDRIDCLKLVTISYELEKYLKSGGQNVLKKFYNEYEHIAFFQVNSNSNYWNEEIAKKEQLKTNHNNVITQQLQKISQNKETFVPKQLDVERILINQIKRIYNSESYETQEQKQIQINKHFDHLYSNLERFNILKISLLHGLQHHKCVKALEEQNSSKKTKPNKYFFTKEITKSFLQRSNSPDQENQKVHIFQTVNKKNVNALIQSNSKNKQASSLKPYRLDDFSNVDMENGDISIIQKPSTSKTNKDNEKNQKKKEALNTSSPFICEITQIGGLNEESFNYDDNGNNNDGTPQKNQGGVNKFSKKEPILLKNGDIQDSLFLPKQLQQLRIDRNMYKIILPNQNSHELPECRLLLTTYAGSGGFHQLQKSNISLVINMSPSECYNYFIHDFAYEWFDVEPIHKVLSEEELFSRDFDSIKEEDQYLYNIQCLVYGVIDRINSEVESIMQGNELKPPKVVIFCNHKNMIYSGTFTVAYLMFTNQFRLSFEQAYQTVKQSTNNKFKIPKIYETQLRDLQRRIDEASSTANLNSLNTKSSSYRGYEVGLYNKRNLSFTATRYVGELTSSNQLQLLENNGLKTYFLVPNNLTSIIIKAINILRQDSSLLSSGSNTQKLSNISKLIKNMGLSLRFFSGKEITNDQKQLYFSFAKDNLLSQLIRYEYMNFSKKIFNVQKYKAKLQLIIDSLKELIVAQFVQKSFRKPQPFDQLPLSIVRDIDLLKSTPLSYKQTLIHPFNPKQTLTFKYPILRPIFESKKKDSYYFMIKKFQDQSEKKTNGMGCNVTFFKGENWIGLEEDKERYFEKIVQEYLKDVNEERIWIEDDQDEGGDKSLFDRDSIMMF